MRAIFIIALFSCAAAMAGAAPAAAKTHAVSAKERHIDKVSQAQMNHRSSKAAAAARQKLDARERSREVEMNRLLRGICTGC